MWRDKDKAAKQVEPEVDEEFDEFMDRCTESGEDPDECRLIWTEARIAKPPKTKSGDGKPIIYKTHAEPAVEMEFVMSDETLDRMGDVIMSDGWDLSEFQNNKICLFNHNSNFVLGSWSNVHVKDGKLRGKLNLLSEGKSVRIDEIRALIEEGHLVATSVGFTPVEHEPLKSGDPFGGNRYKRQKLVECSVVSVPANPNALAIAKSLNLHDDTVSLVFAKPGSPSTRVINRRFTGKPADTSPNERRAMSLNQRIADSQQRIVALRDKLTDHLTNVDDSNVSDADLETTSELNAKIAQEEKGLAALQEANKRLALSSDDQDTNGTSRLPVTTSRGNGARQSFASKKQLSGIDYLVRDGVVNLLANRYRRSIDDVRQAIYGDDENTKAFIEYSQKAATAPATTTTTGWAVELIQQVNADFMDPLVAKAIYPKLKGMGLSLSFGRNGKISIPTRNATPTIAGSFVGEGAPIPVRQGAFSAAVLTPKKMAVITAWTREIDEHSVPALEGLLRDAIQNDTAVSLDAVLLDANAATSIRPAGLLNGVAGLTATSGGGIAALIGDMKQLIGALNTGTGGNIRNLVWLMNPAQVLSIQLTANAGGIFPFKDEISNGKLLTHTVIESGTVTAGVVIVLDAADFVTVGGDAPRFEISDQATLHMEDTTPLAIGTAGTPPTVAAPVRSLWQTDSMALRLILPINWVLRRTGMVAWTSAVTW
jgi:HK97 family phage major capsid protein/HK97 family phage prohead protease